MLHPSEKISLVCYENSQQHVACCKIKSLPILGLPLNFNESEITVKSEIDE